MCTDYPVHKNITLLHFSLINQRLLYEETRESLAESSRLFEICEKYLFERYLDLTEDILEVPVVEFEAELVEMLVHDFESLDKSIACYGYNKSYIILDEKPGYDLPALILQYAIFSEIFENKIAAYDPQVQLLVDYFNQHVRSRQKSYLEGLSYYSLLTEKIDWGLKLLDK